MMESWKRKELERIKPDLVKKIAGKDEELSSLHLKQEGGLPKGVIWGAVGLIVLFVVAFGYISYVEIKSRFNSAVRKNIGEMQSGVQDLRNFDPLSAQKDFSAANSDLDLTFGSLISRIQPFFKDAGNLFGGVQKLTELGAGISQETAFFKENLLADFTGGKGADIIAHLDTVDGMLKDIESTSDSFSSSASDIGIPGSSSTSTFATTYLPIRLDVANAEKAIGSLAYWLKSDGTKHVLLLFQNTSEMRPGGGFLGSYADVAIASGSLAGVSVHDIADADLAFKANIVPPKPLQAEVARFRPADANWFFDFPQSAAEVVRYMESSTIYSASSTQFSGVVAISPAVIHDFLSVIGPLTLPLSHVTLDQDNFLEVLQAKVQAGQAQGSTYPKGVLRELSSALLSKLSSADDATKHELFSMAQDWLANKDVMLYSRNPDIEGLFAEYGAAGGVYAPAANFEGDYLALADANVNGAKTDLFMGQTVTLQSQINASGSVTDHLVIDRANNGDTRSEWWYHAPNRDYLQVFAPFSSSLVNFSGGSAKTIVAPLNYSRKGYSTDPLVAAIESSTAKIFNYPAVFQHEEDGMSVFSTWTNTDPGKATEIVFDYSHRLYTEVGDGTEYTFVFEKQAGSNRNYVFDISAPVGFRFKENSLPVYEYKGNDPPGRMVVNLTLEKI